MRAKIISLDPDAVDPDGIFTVDTVTVAGALTLAGALVTLTVATMDYARRIGILSSGVDTGITFTIVGTDADGRAISEAVTGGSSTTATSVLYFKTITSITASGAAAGNVTIGTVDELVSRTIPLDHYDKYAPTISVEAVTGTLDITIEESFSDMWSDTAFVFQAAMSNLSGVTHADLDRHVHGMRVEFNSYTAGADVRLSITSNG